MPPPVAIRRVLALLGLLLAAAAIALTGAGASQADLNARQGLLSQSIGAENQELAGLSERLTDLRGRLSTLNGTISTQDGALLHTQTEMVRARTRLTRLEALLNRGRRLLAAQLVAQYESPAPSLVGVVLSAHGFPQLLNQVGRMRTLAQHNSEVLVSTSRARSAVDAQTRRLAAVHAHQLRIAAATLSERDQVASLQLRILDRQRVTRLSRVRHLRQLTAVRHRLAVLRARALAAQRAAFAAASADSGGASIASGDDGFFPAPGTNYSVGEEPEIASRLNTLGRALHLHLIGISGYRSPEHSVEVGGFADDPHTRGEASDTPGVEGVPEATLEHYGLTRPFPGPAEADHIQLN